MANVTSQLTFNLDTTTLQDKLPALVAIGVPIATALYIFRWWADGNKKSPPLVPYVFPIIGSSLEYNKDPKGFIRKATEKYGSTFRIYLNGRVQTIVGKDHVRSVTLVDEFSFTEAIKDVFDLDAMFGNNSGNTHAIVTKHITPNLKFFTPRVVQKLAEYEKLWLGDKQGPITLDNPSQMIQDMVANASMWLQYFFTLLSGSGSCDNKLFHCTELCKNKEFVHTAKTLTTDIGKVFSAKGILFMVPMLSKLYQILRFRFTNPTSRHLEVICKTIGPEVERRVREAREEAWDRPQDVLQSMIEEIPPTTPMSTMIRMIGNEMINLLFASIHTTTSNSLSMLYAIADHEEYVDELLEEQEAVLAEEENEEAEEENEDTGEGAKFNMRAIKNMTKLDSFLREVFRLSEPAAILTHKNIHSEGVILPDGHVVAKGEHVMINAVDIYGDETLQGSNPELFDPWRFVNKAKQSSKVGPDYLKFGMGKHACPGRFLAIQEIKTLVSHLIRKYRITRPENDKTIA
ncbi:cytochrome P450 [Endogone sp. FLAS-F59071]|nr:cytochrome P450 [Endogone sp. FLAS-F59071]|eukprot:RUS20931.1 cytochrome P450 [Endogone sp. FLAS-F59071]